MLGEGAKKGELVPKEMEHGYWHSAKPLSVTVIQELVGESFRCCCGPALWGCSTGTACPYPGT